MRRQRPTLLRGFELRDRIPVLGLHMRGLRWDHSTLLRHHLQLGDDLQRQHHLCLVRQRGKSLLRDHLRQRIHLLELELRGVWRGGATLLRGEFVHGQHHGLRERLMHGVRRAESTVLRGRHPVQYGGADLWRHQQMRDLRRDRTTLLRQQVQPDHRRLLQRDVRNVRRHGPTVLCEQHVFERILVFQQSMHALRGGHADVLHRNELRR